MTIPTIAEIEAQEITAVEGAIGQTIPSFARAYFRVQAKSHSGVLSLVYRFAKWCLDQTQPETANEFWLTIWGDRYGVTRQASVAARLTASATGVNGTEIPAGTLWQTSAGVVYSQETLVTISGGTSSITIGCLTRGAASNLGNGIVLTTVSPVAGIDNTATTTATLTTGEDRQALEEFRAEVIDRIRYRPQGGAIPDYVIWAREVAGIVKAFVVGGGGDVTVYPLIATTGASRIPGAPKIAEVLAYISDPIRKPIGANVYVSAPTERTAAVTITGLASSQDLAQVKANIQTALEAYFYAAYPRQYDDEVDPTDYVSVAPIWSAIYANGATATAVTLSISGIGGGPYTLPIGEIIKISGAITWA